MALKQIGSLWRKEGKKGNYLSGVLNGITAETPIVIFQQENKEKENHPDAIIYRVEPDEK